jgi:hypothetical protein
LPLGENAVLLWRWSQPEHKSGSTSHEGIRFAF